MMEECPDSLKYGHMINQAYQVKIVRRMAWNSNFG